MFLLKEEYIDLCEDTTLFSQAKLTIQALFTLSCVEFISANKQRIRIKDRQENLYDYV